MIKGLNGDADRLFKHSHITGQHCPDHINTIMRTIIEWVTKASTHKTLA